MLKTYLATASVAAMLATGAMAQTAAPAPTAPAAPAQTQTAPSTTTTMTRAANEQLTTRKIVGISIYAPKPGSTATTGSTAAPAAPAAGTAGSMASGSAAAGQMMITPVSDEQWRTMRDQHDSIGEINDLVVGADGRITHAVLGVGGFLGIGEKNVALQLSQVRLMRQSDGTLIGFVTNTKAQLQEMPNFDASRS